MRRPFGPYDLPLHPVDRWAYDHHARLPAGDTLDDQLGRGPEAAADAFESVSRLRLGLVLDDIRSRDLGTVPVIVEGPQLMPGFAGRLPPGWGVWLVPDPARTRLAREERLAKAEALGGPAAAGRLRGQLLVERDAVIAGRVRASAARSGRPVIEVPPDPDWPAIAAAAETALGALVPVRVRMRDERVPRYLDGYARRLRRQDRFRAAADRPPALERRPPSPARLGLGTPSAASA
jgi:hypothetical protein